MAVRTSAAAVKAILLRHYDTVEEPDLTAFIDTAASLVDSVEAGDVDGILTLASKELIERWLAAHFYGHGDQLYQNRSTSKASGTFQGQTAMVLNSTQYGQTAMLLDRTGYLAKLNQEAITGQKRELKVTWLGSTEAEQPRSYEDW